MATMPLFDHYSEVGAVGRAGCTWRSDGPGNKIIESLSCLDFHIYTANRACLGRSSPCCLSEKVPEDHRLLRMKSRLFLFYYSPGTRVSSDMI